MSGAICIKDGTFSYEAEIILQDINLTIGSGEFVSVIGPSGCGKSTLLRLLAGLLTPQAGSIQVNGNPVTGPGLDRAVVFQDYSLFSWMSCRDNVMLALEQAKIGENTRDRERIAESYLALVGLQGNGGKLPGELSGGMRQRTAIARALAQNAPLLLMDEPFGALDEITRARQQDMLLDLWQRNSGKTVLFVTHDVDEALLLSDRVILLAARPGRIARTFEVDLPRPRSHHTARQDSRFKDLRNEIVSALDRVVRSEMEA
ncbi:MAG: ABC transporter ATP-binding protein [Spirochaetaceae bacterium]|jgi:NitT/TauT family transport system ATP-binding protein|nr:ABC transporter ATP-binding protein [Spirochaetaceae bacterium]